MTTSLFRVPRPLRRHPLHAAAICAASAASLAAGACSPCDGVIGCDATPRLGLSGQFVSRDVVDAPPVPGVRVDVVSRSPDILADSVATATSDATGWWSVSMRARVAGSATVDVVVTPPAPDPPYRVTGLSYATRTTRGTGSETGRWVPRPFISYIGVLIDQASGKPIGGAQVTVVRRGGVTVTPTSATDTAPKTDYSGTFLYDVKPASLAPLFVDFLVDRPGLPRTTIANAIVTPGYEWTPPHAYAVTTFTIDSAGHASGPGIVGSQAGVGIGAAPRAAGR